MLYGQSIREILTWASYGLVEVKISRAFYVIWPQIAIVFRCFFTMSRVVTANSNISNFLGFFLVSRKPLLLPRYCVIDLGTVLSCQSFVWRQLIIAPICYTKKPPIFPSKNQIWSAERCSCLKCVYLHIFRWLALVKYLLHRYTCLLATTVVYCSFCSNQSLVWAD